MDELLTSKTIATYEIKIVHAGMMRDQMKLIEEGRFIYLKTEKANRMPTKSTGNAQTVRGAMIEH